jgi:hypothetical protein
MICSLSLQNTSPGCLPSSLCSAFRAPNSARQSSTSPSCHSHGSIQSAFWPCRHLPRLVAVHGNTIPVTKTTDEHRIRGEDGGPDQDRKNGHVAVVVSNSHNSSSSSSSITRPLMAQQQDSQIQPRASRHQPFSSATHRLSTTHPNRPAYRYCSPRMTFFTPLMILDRAHPRLLKVQWH